MAFRVTIVCRAEVSDVNTRADRLHEIADLCDLYEIRNISYGSHNEFFATEYSFETETVDHVELLIDHEEIGMAAVLKLSSDTVSVEYEKIEDD